MMRFLSGRTARISALTALAIVLATVIIGQRLGGSVIERADPGAITEAAWPLPRDVPLPELTTATARWNLAQPRAGSGEVGPMAGGMALDDLDGDGDLDLVVAQGSVAVYRWQDGAYLAPIDVGLADAHAVTSADIDLDGSSELLIAREGAVDSVVWSTGWVENGAAPTAITDLPGTSPSGGLLAGPLSGGAYPDILRLGRGTDRGAPDVLWIFEPDPQPAFREQPVADDERLSLAAELVDVDRDGLLDIWVTRDVGWDTGPDSIYSRGASQDGDFVDIAADVGADLAVDGMGVTIADLGGGTQFDAYISDLGDNEVLIRSGTTFRQTSDTGAARIRPPDTPASAVSSSWASGTIDANLDGVLDLVVTNGGFVDREIRNKIPDTEVLVDDSLSLLLGRGDGTYVDVWPDLELPRVGASRSVTIGDVDADGDDDLIVLAIDGSLHAFENRASGPTVTVVPSPLCRPVAPGVEVIVRTGGNRFATLLLRNTYNGAHAPGVIVGAPGGRAEIAVEWLRSPRFTKSIDGLDERPVVIAGC